MLEIGDDIALVVRDHNLEEDGAQSVLTITYRARARPPMRRHGVRLWRFFFQGYFLHVEARPGPCISTSGETLADHVTVRTRSRTLTGCGGPAGLAARRRTTQP